MDNVVGKILRPLRFCFDLDCDEHNTDESDDHQSFSSYQYQMTNINFNDVWDCKLWAKGAFCEVFFGKYKGEKVILKTAREDLSDTCYAERCLEKELEILQSINHKNVVRLYGSGSRFNNVSSKLVIAVEYLNGGTLRELIQRTRGKLGEGGNVRFSFGKAIQLASSLAEALFYLHEKVSTDYRVIHRDLKPDNIGFHNGVLKLFDFGLSIFAKRGDLKRDSYIMTGLIGTLRYMAPEVALKQHYNEKVDCYSFAMITWEILTLSKPFKNFGPEEFFQFVVHGGQRPNLETDWPINFRNLLAKCWDRNSGVRPAFKTITSTLKSVISTQTSKGGIHQQDHASLDVSLPTR